MDTGIIADLEDQAAWGSYTQDIPRLGDAYRESIRLARYRRYFAGLFRGKALGGDWWVAIFVTCIIGLVILGVIWGTFLLLR